MADNSEAPLSPEMRSVAPLVLRSSRNRAAKAVLRFGAAWVVGLICTGIFEPGWVKPYLIAGAAAFVFGAVLDAIVFFRQAQNLPKIAVKRRGLARSGAYLTARGTKRRNVVIVWTSVAVIFWFLSPPMASAPVAFFLGIFVFTLTKPMYAKCDPEPNTIAQLITIGHYGTNPDDPIYAGLPETIQDGIGT